MPFTVTWDKGVNRMLGGTVRSGKQTMEERYYLTGKHSSRGVMNWRIRFVLHRYVTFKNIFDITKIIRKYIFDVLTTESRQVGHGHYKHNQITSTLDSVLFERDDETDSDITYNALFTFIFRIAIPSWRRVKVKGEGHQSQVSFMLHYYIALTQYASTEVRKSPYQTKLKYLIQVIM